MGRVPPGLIVGLAILGIGVILCIVGIATVEWVTLDAFDQLYYGLFKYCYGSSCTQYVDFDSNPFSTPEYKAAIGCLLTGLILGGLSFICNLVYLLLYLRGPTTTRVPETVALVFSLVGAALLLAGAIVFVVHLVDLSSGTYLGLHYSFFLTLAGLVLILIGGITTYVTTRRSRPQGGQVMSPGQTNIVVQTQTGAAYSQQQYPPAQQPPQWSAQQYPPAQQPPQWSTQQYPPAQSTHMTEGWNSQPQPYQTQYPSSQPQSQNQGWY